MARKRLPAKERRRQILRCAVKVFARSNFQVARVADIAAEAGISEAAVYKYFPSKKSIYLEILRHMSDRIITFWQEEVDREEDALDALENMGFTYYNRMNRRPDEVRVQFQAIAEVNHNEIADRLRNDHESYRDFIAQVLRKGVRQGRIRKDVDLEAVAWIYDAIGVLMNLMKLLSLENEFTEETIAGIMRHMGDSIKEH